jgi:hypothetical protein
VKVSKSFTKLVKVSESFTKLVKDLMTDLVKDLHLDFERGNSLKGMEKGENSLKGDRTCSL